MKEGMIWNYTVIFDVSKILPNMGKEVCDEWEDSKDWKSWFRGEYRWYKMKAQYHVFCRWHGTASREWKRFLKISKWIQ